MICMDAQASELESALPREVPPSPNELRAPHTHETYADRIN